MRRMIAVGLTVAAVGCGTEAPVAAPGTLTASLVGPAAEEGAAVVVLVGEAIDSVMSIGSADVFASVGTEGTQVVVIHPTGGLLEFAVAVSDTTQPISAVVQEVAGPNDELRSELAAYSVDFRR